MALLNSISPAAVTGAQIVWTAAAAGGDRVVPGSRTFLLVRNASASSVNVTLDATGIAFNNQAIPDTVVAVPAGQDRIIPIRREYASAADGLAGVTYSAVTSVTVSVISL